MAVHTTLAGMRSWVRSPAPAQTVTASALSFQAPVRDSQAGPQPAATLARTNEGLGPQRDTPPAPPPTLPRWSRASSRPRPQAPPWPLEVPTQGFRPRPRPSPIVPSLQVYCRQIPEGRSERPQSRFRAPRVPADIPPSGRPGSAPRAEPTPRLPPRRLPRLRAPSPPPSPAPPPAGDRRGRAAAARLLPPRPAVQSPHSAPNCKPASSPSPAATPAPTIPGAATWRGSQP